MTKYMTKRRAEHDFKAAGQHKIYRHDGSPDKHAIRVAWDAYVDDLCKSGRISESQYNRWLYPLFCRAN